MFTTELPPPYGPPTPTNSSTVEDSMPTPPILTTPTPTPPSKPRWDSIDDKDHYVQSNECTQAVSLLSRWLLEILAFTFEGDIATLGLNLNPMLGDSIPALLSAQERQMLLGVAHLLRDLCKKINTSDWYTTPSSDHQHIIDTITKPCKVYKLPPAYVMALLASYADHRCDPALRSSTLLSKRVPRFLEDRRRFTSSLTDLGDDVRFHANVVEGISVDEEGRKLLQRAVASYLERRGLTALPVSDSRTCWSTREFWNVAGALNPFDDSFHGKIARGTCW